MGSSIFTDNALNQKFGWSTPQGRDLSSKYYNASKEFDEGKITLEELEKHRNALEEGRKKYRDSHEQPANLMESSYRAIVDLLVGKGLITVEDGQEPVLDDILKKIDELFGEKQWLLNIFRIPEQGTGEE